MQKLSGYFKCSAVLLFLYSVLTFWAWFALAAGMGWPPLPTGPASSVTTLDAYASGSTTGYTLLTYLSYFVLVPALPAMMFFLYGKYPGTAVSGFALGAVSYVLAMLDVFLAAGARAAAAGPLTEAAFVGTLTRGDLTLTLDTVAMLFFVPAMWFGILFAIVWGIGYARLAGAARWAGTALLASVFFTFVSLGGFFIGSDLIANLGVLAQTIALSAAFALAAVALWAPEKCLPA